MRDSGGSEGCGRPRATTLRCRWSGQVSRLLPLQTLDCSDRERHRRPRQPRPSVAAAAPALLLLTAAAATAAATAAVEEREKDTLVRAGPGGSGAVAAHGSEENWANGGVANASYWEALYAGDAAKLVSGPLAYSWQSVGYAQLRAVLEPLLVDGRACVLVLGCGDSNVPKEIVDAGAQEVTAVDFSPTVIKAMAAKAAVDTPPRALTWLAEDVTSLSLDNDTFDVAVDVGVLDTLASGGEHRARDMLLEAHRALRPGGAYVSVSTEPPAFRVPLLRRHPFPGGWNIVATSTLPRPRSLDPRVVALNPGLQVGNLSVYVSLAVDKEELRRQEDEQAEEALEPEVSAGQQAGGDTGTASAQA